MLSSALPAASTAIAALPEYAYRDNFLRMSQAGRNLFLERVVEFYKKGDKKKEASEAYWLAYCCTYGIGTKRDIQVAIETYERSIQHAKNSNLGYGKTAFNLAMNYLRKNNIEKAKQCLSEAVKQGYSKAESELLKLIEATKSSAAANNVSASASAPASAASGASAYASLPALASVPSSARQDASDLDIQLLTNEFFESALGTFMKGRAEGDAQAAIYAGECYKEGLGDTKNYLTAVECYERAYRRYPFAAAAQCLGDLYSEGGHGLRKNLEKAKRWYTRALRRGFDAAKDSLENLHKKPNVNITSSSSRTKAAPITLTGTLANGMQIACTEEPIVMDGNCGFIGLGVDRRELTACLSNKRNNEKVRESIWLEIAEFLMSGAKHDLKSAKEKIETYY